MEVDLEYMMRPIKEQDLELLLKWRNSESIRSKMFTDHMITKKEHYEWFNKISKQDILSHFIFEYKNNPIGYIAYTDIDFGNKTCSSALYLGEKNLPVNAGIIIEFYTINYAFQEIGVRKVWGYVLASNKRVIQLHKYFGYQNEGCLKEHLIKQGTYQDVLIMSVFREDWLHKKNILGKLLFNN